MSRIPKYRAWHKAEKKMCDVSIINTDKGAFLIGVNKGEDQIGDKFFIPAPEDGRFCPFEDIEMLEYTGLKDKNKVECCEGDVLEYDFGNGKKLYGIIEYHIKEVEHGYGEVCLVGFMLKNHPYTHQEYSVIPHDLDIEIIGNIYQNPTLL